MTKTLVATPDTAPKPRRKAVPAAPPRPRRARNPQPQVKPSGDNRRLTYWEARAILVELGYIDE